MKTVILTIAAVFAIASGAIAQNGYSVYRGATSSHPPNGFRTVAEENALMEKTLRERRQKEIEESGLSAEERAKLKQEEAEAAKKRAAERNEGAAAKPKSAASATKNARSSKTTSAANKPKPAR